MNIRFAHEDCEHCQSYVKQALTTMETLGFGYIGIGNNFGHSVKIDKEEEATSELSGK